MSLAWAFQSSQATDLSIFTCVFAGHIRSNAEYRMIDGYATGGKHFCRPATDGSVRFFVCG